MPFQEAIEFASSGLDQLDSSEICFPLPRNLDISPCGFLEFFIQLTCKFKQKLALYSAPQFFHVVVLRRSSFEKEEG
jgi:hypothetical protein